MKKKFMSILIAVVFAVGMAGNFPVTVRAAIEPVYKYGDFYYSLLEDGTVSIADYTGLTTDVEIPSTINGYKVTTIGTNSFKDHTSLTSVIIPNGVTEIGIAAFSGCTSLVSVTMPEGVKSISDYAFYDCSLLTSMVVPTDADAKTVANFQNQNQISTLSENNATYDSAGNRYDNNYIYLDNGRFALKKGVWSVSDEEVAGTLSCVIDYYKEYFGDDFTSIIQDTPCIIEFTKAGHPFYSKY
jgi:hypothetical protein